MAIDILLRGQRCLHEPKHDLESVFYVLIWLCVLYDGPNGSERQGFSVYHTELRYWLLGDTTKTIGRHKYSMVVDPRSFESNILSLFSPYFEDLKPCVSALRNALLLTPPITHEIMIDIIKRAYDILPQIEDIQRGYTPPQQQKRKPDDMYEEDAQEGEESGEEDETVVDRLGVDHSQEEYIMPPVCKAAGDSALLGLAPRPARILPKTCTLLPDLKDGIL